MPTIFAHEPADMNSVATEHVIDWREVVQPLSDTDPDIIDVFDTLQKLLPLTVFCATRHGEPNLIMDKYQRIDTISAWLEEGKKRRFISPEETAAAIQMTKTIWFIP